MNLSRKDGTALAALFILMTFLFGFKLGAVGFLDPDEAFYALTAKEMLARNDFLTPVLFGSPQFEKPIFYYWVLIAFFKMGGITEFAARLGSCLAGMLTVFITYFWGRVLFKKKEIAFLSALVLVTSAQFIVLSRIVLTDIFLCLFVTAAFFCFSLGYTQARSRKAAWLFLFVFCALGFLTKGPLGVLLPFLGIVSYLAVNRELFLLKEMPWAPGTALFLLVGCAWYGIAAWHHGVDFLKHFFLHENLRRFFTAEHKRFDEIWFYPAGLLLGFFPWSAFIPAAISHARKCGFLFLSFLLPFLFFMAAKSKLLSYTFPLFPIMALLLGIWLWKFARAVRMGFRIRRGLLWACFLAWGIFPLFWPALFFLARRQCRRMLVSLVIATALFSALVFGWILPLADAVFSSKSIVSFYRKLELPPPAAIFSTKMLFRGVSYYLGEKNLAVLIEDKRRAFYTSPVLRLISSPEDFSDFTSAGLPVYGFVRPRELEYLGKLTSGRWTLDVMGADAGKYLVKVDSLK